MERHKAHWKGEGRDPWVNTEQQEELRRQRAGTWSGCQGQERASLPALFTTAEGQIYRHRAAGWDGPRLRSCWGSLGAGCLRGKLATNRHQGPRHAGSIPRLPVLPREQGQGRAPGAARCPATIKRQIRGTQGGSVALPTPPSRVGQGSGVVPPPGHALRCVEDLAGNGRAPRSVVTHRDIFKPSSPQEETLARPLGSDALCPTSAFVCSALCGSLG